MLQLSLRKLNTERAVPDSEKAYMEAQIDTMMQKETEYQCNDYISTHSKLSSSDNHAEGFVVDELCRQKMCEWSYRIVEHCHAGRELVAVAQNYVDRFLDQHRCNCTTYKLLSITALYLSVKIHNTKPFSMSSLANLSKGEFLVEDIAEMEMVLLRALDWNMSPPTAACFCGCFHALLPLNMKPSVRQTILQRSCFFCELSVMDYTFTVSVSQSEIAFGSILNSLAGLSTSSFSVEGKQDFIKDIEERSGMDHSSERIRVVQEELWILYRRSNQYTMYDSTNMIDCIGNYDTSKHQSSNRSNKEAALIEPSRDQGMNLLSCNSPNCITASTE